RDELLKSALGAEGVLAVATCRTEVAAADAGLAAIAGSRRVAYVGAVHTGSGTFVGTGAQGGRPRPIHVLSRGDVTKPGKEVAPGAITSIPGINGNFSLAPNHTEGDRRAALAKWLSDPSNPLTWRVM